MTILTEQSVKSEKWPPMIRHAGRRDGGMIGRLISHYRIIQKVGHGGLGEVFLAEDTILSRRVAMKFLWAAESAESRQQILAEARSAASIDHPYICKIFETGEFEGESFIVMEYVEGETLAQQLKSRQLGMDETLRIASEIGEALADAHDRSIVHCDLKPSNVMIARTGHVKLMDFGLARIVRQRANPSEGTQEITLRDAKVLGTPAYMPPEQARGDNLDPRTDVFAFGIVFYEMLSGVHPFRRLTPETTMAAILHEQPPQIEQFLHTIPKPLVKILQRALAKDRSERFASGRELLSDLIRCQKEGLTDPSFHPSVPVQPAIAILPFTDFSPQGNHEYLCQGLAEELIAALSTLEHLRVASRTAAFRYRNANVELEEIGRTLNVTSVLEGSVQRSGERVRIVVRLIDLKSGYPVWSERYDRKMDDIFEIQDDITRSVVEKLRLTFVNNSPLKLIHGNPQTVRAYELYLKGRFFWNKRTEENLTLSTHYFQRSLLEDPGYALAHAGLADAYVTLALYGAMPPLEVMPVAAEAAERALEINPDLPEAMTPRACVRALFDWDWQASAADFDHAIRLNPRYAQARQWYAMNCLCPQGQFESARTELNQAAQLEPVSLAIATSLGILLFFERHYDAAIAQFHAALEMDENFYLARYFLAQAYCEKRMYRESLYELERAATASQQSSEMIAARGYIRALAGHPEETREALKTLSLRSNQRYVSPVLMAQLHMALQDKDSAIASLEEAFRLRSTDLIWLNVRPAFDPIRKDPRVLDLLARMALSR